MASTYGDYSSVKISRIVCLKCRKIIKDFSLQQLLDQDESLCPACRPQPTEAEKEKEHVHV